MVVLASDADVEARLGRDLDTSETAAVAGLITEASVLVVGYLNRDWTALADVPDAVRVVVSRMVARALTGSSNIPAGTESFSSSLSVMSHTVKLGTDVAIGSPWLSKADKISLDPHRAYRGLMNVPMY